MKWKKSGSLTTLQQAQKYYLLFLVILDQEAFKLR